MKLHKLYQPYSIYGLKDETGNIIYIGKTQKVPIRLRLHGHKYTKLAASIFLIEKVVDKKNAIKRETYWINYYLSIGCTLCNIKQVKKIA